MDIREIDTWFFDLDDTCYPRSSGMWEQSRQHILDYVVQHFGVSESAAQAIRRGLVERHGTTMRGLQVEEGVDPRDFVAFEDGLMDYSVLCCDERFVSAVAALPGRRVILTNASAPHARSVLTARGMTELFDGVFDISAAGYVPKPHEQTYRAALERFDADPARSCMLDDKPANLEVPAALGMATVLVDEGRDNATPWQELGPRSLATGDLTACLESLAGGPSV